eukprot:COSAG02_NODE_30837_length_544_cov_1.076404_1_plen_95_part_01
MWRRGARRLSPLDPQSVSDRRKEGLQRVWAACREGRPPVRTAAALLCVHTIGAVGGSSLEYPITMAAPRKIVSLAHIKAKDEPEPPKPRRIAHHG